MNPEVSIIMPVYNSEKYIKDAIESVLAQNYENFELICIDDGSSDKSFEIIKEYENTDSRVKAFKKQNGGISSTRNFGIKHATGKYIAFIDNDDEYKEDFLKDNIEILEQENSEIIKFGKVKKYIGIEGKEEKTNCNFEKTTLTNEQIWANFEKIYKFGGTIWNAIYKKEFLDKYNILFDENNKNVIEDHQFNLECYKHISKLSLNPNIYYIWKMRVEHSTSAKFIYERFENIKIQANNLYLLLKKKGIDKLNPHFWAKLKISYLINIILVMNYESSGFNTKKAKKYLKSLLNYELFARKCQKDDYKYLKKVESKSRIISLKLFDNGFYKILFLMSNMKMKKEINENNRRF